MSIDVSLVIVKKDNGLVCYFNTLGGREVFRCLIHNVLASALRRDNIEGLKADVFKASPDFLEEEVFGQEVELHLSYQEIIALRGMYPEDKYRWQYVCS